MSTAAPPPAGSQTGQELHEPRSRRGTPVWEIAHLYPLQGHWSEQAYFGLETKRRIEYADGCLEFLPMPTRSHERIVKFLFRLLDEFALRTGRGEAFFAGIRVRTIDRFYRLPDLLFITSDRPQEEQFAHGADLAIEVVSEGEENRRRDLREKRAEYAAAGVPEYWIVDPEQKTITVLTLDGDEYRVHGEFNPGATATSVLLEGFTVDVTACFAAADDAAAN
ncbi:MAG: Uma2 family endonuclease [Planctomycetota bacterium]|nr:MAG: Uma2 family endonuclease [Planctomycetota bacterium]REJ95527.1 MAG: Uma2 family endonuclease [Planctomycetota bacterium]REK21913.1 MAG: Uma2 family endonuclease [Planctomycetota bacterium]REK32175.1 MAG: Uma2 family endonuclease [Planctomycetota bacterium]